MTGARAQTNLDFLVGVGVFLLAVGFVVALVPELFTPFGGEQSGPLVANRAADTAVGLLRSPEPGVLNATCTLAFFGAAPDDGCGFDGGEPLPARLGATGYDLNVTLERNVTGDAGREVLCASGGAVVDCGSGGTRLAAGDPAPDDGRSVVVATRAVVVDGEHVTLTVRTW